MNFYDFSLKIYFLPIKSDPKMFEFDVTKY